MTPICNVSGTGRFRCSWFLIALLVTGAAQSADAPAKSSATAPAKTAGAPAKSTDASPKTESQLKAAAVLKSMAEYLAARSSFTCTSTNNFETVQADGQRIEFGETRRISLQRPNRLRIDEVESDSTNDMALFDGTQITVLSGDLKVYAQAPQPPSIEDALVYFVRDLRMRMPLALMLSSHVRTELPNLAKQIDYVESTEVRGQKADHLAGRGDSVDFQFWIAQGASPLPLRIIITYKLDKGQPRFSADISDWYVSPSFTANTFQLALPSDAKKIPFAVQLLAPPAESQPAAASGATP